MELPSAPLATVRVPAGFSVTAPEWQRKQQRLAAFVAELFAPEEGAAPVPTTGQGATLDIIGRWKLSESKSAAAHPSSTTEPSETPAPPSTTACPAAPTGCQAGRRTGPDCDCFEPPVLFDPDDPTPITYPRRFQIELGPSKIHGQGVFARKRFVDKEVVEVCPVLEIHSRNVGGILEDYVFCADRKGWRCAVLGYGMMYNSWIHANLAYYRDEQGNFVYVACRDIEKGEELLIDYGDDWWQSRNKKGAEFDLLHLERDAKPDGRPPSKAEAKGPGGPPTKAAKASRPKKPKPKPAPRPHKNRRKPAVLELDAARKA